MADDEARARWLAERRSGIGGSDAPAVMGVSRWKTRYSLWADKTGVEPDRRENEITRWGHVLEQPIAEEYECLTGRKLRNLGTYAIQRHPERPWMIATHDRIIEPIDDRGHGLLSIKYVGPFAAKAWQEGEPPVEYQVQAQHEAAVSGFRWVSFAVLIWGEGVVWQDAPRNEPFIEALTEEEHAFWRRVEAGDAPAPDDTEETEAALRRLYPEDRGHAVLLPDEALAWRDEALRLREERKRIEAKIRELDNRAKDALKDAAAGVVGRQQIVTWRAYEKDGFTVAPSLQRPLLWKKPKTDRRGEEE